MLAEILFASVPTKREPRQDRKPGISCSGLFPCPYRLLLVHTDKMWDEKLEPKQVLNMADGWDQEDQTVRRLAKAGLPISDRGYESRKVVIGKSNIMGSIDGTCKVNNKKYLWEHKAMNFYSFSNFLRWGLKTFPGYKAQVNGYMVGKGLDECLFMSKHKDSNDYHDIVTKLDKPYIEQIIEWADRIRLENWIPEPEECPYCAHCRVDCFGPVIDFSKFETAEAPDMVEKWKKGKQLIAVGEMLEQEARTFFIGETIEKGRRVKTLPGLIGVKEVLRVEDLEVKMMIQHRFNISKQKILQEFGPDGLAKVGEPKDIISYRVKEV